MTKSTLMPLMSPSQRHQESPSSSPQPHLRGAAPPALSYQPPAHIDLAPSSSSSAFQPLLTHVFKGALARRVIAIRLPRCHSRAGGRRGDVLVLVLVLALLVWQSRGKLATTHREDLNQEASN